MNATIPEALHICPGCEAVCSGAKYCARCREEIEARANFHAARANRLYSALPRETGLTVEQARAKLLWELTRLGFAVVMLAVWVWMAVDVYQGWRK